MPFTNEQIQRLKTPVRARHVKQRNFDGKILSYIEGWHVIAEANRIFGYDAWDRETLSSQCLWQKQIDGKHSASYLTRVRLTVRAGATTIIREGLGAGEATALTPGHAHERAFKAAETDATKRAFVTFGNRFGLSLYHDRQSEKRPQTSAPENAMSKGAINEIGNLTPGAPPPGTALPEHTAIDKSVLLLSEPKRIRNREHLRFVASRPCLVCGRQPSQAHHLRFAQPRAMARKVSDEFSVPLCALHHQELHLAGNEIRWWRLKNIDALSIAEELWQRKDSLDTTDAPELSDLSQRIGQHP